MGNNVTSFRRNEYPPFEQVLDDFLNLKIPRIDPKSHEELQEDTLQVHC